MKLNGNDGTKCQITEGCDNPSYFVNKGWTGIHDIYYCKVCALNLVKIKLLKEREERAQQRKVEMSVY